MFWGKSKARVAEMPATCLETRPESRSAPASPEQVSETLYRVHMGQLSDREHAEALLSWLMGAGGRMGYVPAGEMKAAYIEFCVESQWEAHPWQGVAMALRKLLGCSKNTIRIIGGKRRIVYPVIPRKRGRRSPAARANVRQPAADGSKNRLRLVGESTT